MAFGVYIHFPYCLSKCPYCDFASVAERAIPHERYAAAIARELELRLGEAPGRTARSIYLGGGTPSLWQPAAIRAALDAVRAALPLEPGAELTLEANPGAADVARFAGFREAGLNRLSIGVQSFGEAALRALGRRHTAEEAVLAFRAARQAGFDNLALDLIYGAPGQTLAQVRQDAERMAELGPEHVSCYALTLDHLAVEVPMAREVRSGRLAVPDDEAQWEMGQGIREVLGAAGYRRYEISNYARPGREARHNSLYWTGGEYLGLGCGAHGFLYRDPSRPALGGRRWGNGRVPRAYLEAVEARALPEESSESLDAAALLEERLGMGLRQTGGVDLAGACSELGSPLEPVLARAQGLVRQGLGSLEGTRLRLTERGLDFHTEAAVAMLA